MKKIYLLLFLFSGVAVSYAQRQFWGTSSEGGVANKGFIFKTDSIGDNLEIVHSFESALTGENIGALLHASNNKLYGLAGSGGQNAVGVFNGGTFFEYDLATDVFRIIQHFGPSNTALPNVYLPKAEGVSGLTEAAPGLIYGLMRQGEYVFSYNMVTEAFGQPFTIPNYYGGATNGVLRNRLNAAFIKAADGMLYTTTFTNSTCPIPNPYMGSIIRVNPANNALSIIYKNNCVFANGHYFNGNMIEVNGKFYATTQYGGEYFRGVIFEYNPVGNVYTKKHDFNGGVQSYEPSSLVLADNGKLYGTAYGGGVAETNLPNGGGVLYEFDPTTNIFTKKHDFLFNNGWVGDMGSFPRGLVKSSNGKLYGVTRFGVFEYDTFTNAIRAAGRFWTNGYLPSLLQLCRKPAYNLPANAIFGVAQGSDFSHDLQSSNTDTVIWRHDGTPVATQTSTVLAFTNFTANNYGTWTAELTNECGTTITQSVQITDSALSIPDASSLKNLVLHPNPATDWIGITADIAVQSIVIYNMTGQKVAENHDSDTITTEKLIPGVYLLTVRTAQGIWNGKFIKL